LKRRFRPRAGIAAAFLRAADVAILGGEKAALNDPARK